MYKQISRLGLRIPTPKGPLSVDQLWQLSQADLASSIKAIKKVLKKSDDDELSFLSDTIVVDTDNQLRFDVLKDVYLTKKKESEELRDAAVTKAHNQKIDALIAKKQDSDLENLSIEALEKLRK